MFKSFVINPDQSTLTYSSLDEFKEAAASVSNVNFWIDLEQPTEDELNEVGALLHLDPEALEDCLRGEQRPRLDEFEEYIFLVLYGMYGVGDAKDISPRKLAVFCGAEFLVTVHREPVRTIRTVRKRCEKHASHVLKHGIPFLLYSVIDGMIDKYGAVVSDYESQLNEMEERSLESTAEDSIMRDVGEFRKELMELRRIAVAQKELLNPIAKGEFEHFSDELEFRFKHVRDHLTVVVEEIDDMRDRLRLVVDNYRSALAEHMNSIIKVLTIFSAIMLPLTFIAGVYGMNFDKSFWPPSDARFSFAGIIMFMLALTLGLLYIFRRNKWI